MEPAQQPPPETDPGTAQEIQAALGMGHSVVVRGNPMAQGSYGRRAGADAEENFATLSGYQGPLQISEGELRGFQRDPQRPRTEGFGLVVMRPDNAEGALTSKVSWAIIACSELGK